MAGQRSYLIGRRYEENKHIEPFRGNQHTKESGRRTKYGDQKTESRNRTAKTLGKEYGISHRTVQKEAEFSRGLDKIKEKNPDLAKEILSGSTPSAACNLYLDGWFPRRHGWPATFL